MKKKKCQACQKEYPADFYRQKQQKYKMIELIFVLCLLMIWLMFGDDDNYKF